MNVDLSILISIISVFAAVYFGYQAFKRGNSADIEERVEMNTRVMTKLDGISDDLKDMKRDSQDLRKEVNHINERVLILEQATKVHGSSYVEKV